MSRFGSNIEWWTLSGRNGRTRSRLIGASRPDMWNPGQAGLTGRAHSRLKRLTSKSLTRPQQLVSRFPFVIVAVFQCTLEPEEFI